MSSAETFAVVLLAPGLAYFLFRAAQYLVRLATGGEAPYDAEMAARETSVLLGHHLRQIFVWSTEPVVRLLAALGVSPNSLTLLCLGLSIVAGALVGSGELALGGAVGLVGSSFDYFDGRLARRTARSSPAGSFLDSTLDRYCDIAFLAGATVLFRQQVVLLVAAVVALGSSLVISYTRAKVESLGAELTVGLMQRPERVLLFCLGALLDPWLSPPIGSRLAEGWGDAAGGHPVFAGALLLLALFATLTALHRTVVGFRRLYQQTAVDRDPTRPNR